MEKLKNCLLLSFIDYFSVLRNPQVEYFENYNTVTILYSQNDKVGVILCINTGVPFYTVNFLIFNFTQEYGHGVERIGLYINQQEIKSSQFKIASVIKYNVIKQKKIIYVKSVETRFVLYFIHEEPTFYSNFELNIL